ncbi:phosphate acyltransferase PlsX [Capillibacterium thermochitinicola]|uniref:Phosphate acyltransferase n=1 Tax=Capillibacterium thermochitinicola TaxID=2699427 RepID=A0A8J6HWW8_9FIRM|nr:phosphate acyltransferase PlsX [Capillibacterium thermochitinicola]MBA2132822.1 phosphate acyltransferase PlsX [Capillibacterium thermochitinicola]
MRIAVDAMGGDYAPQQAVLGSVLAAKEEGIASVLVGRSEEISRELKQYQDYPQDLITIKDAREVVEFTDNPAMAVRKKRDSSIVVANQLVKTGEADAVISAGNTGAAMTASLFILGRIPGISRPAIAIPLPTVKGVTVLLDAGANAENDPEDLVQFAVMGTIYATSVLGLASAKVGLLNIGEEETKGNKLSLEAHQLLKTSGLDFIGNVEGKDILMGVADVVVCDGFVGNVILKFAEGMAAALFQKMKEALLQSPVTKLGALAIKPGLKKLKASFDYAEYGGAPLLGVNGVSIISHGRSDAKAFKNAIKAAANGVKQDIIAKIRSSLV